jgi:hypothetical protein
MGFLFLGPSANTCVDREDNENCQADNGQAEPEDSNDQIKRCDTGEHCGEPNYEKEKFTHKFFYSLVILFFHFACIRVF